MSWRPVTTNTATMPANSRPTPGHGTDAAPAAGTVVAAPCTPASTTTVMPPVEIDDEPEHCGDGAGDVVVVVEVVERVVDVVDAVAVDDVVLHSGAALVYEAVIVKCIAAVPARSAWNVAMAFSWAS